MIERSTFKKPGFNERGEYSAFREDMALAQERLVEVQQELSTNPDQANN